MNLTISIVNSLVLAQEQNVDRTTESIEWIFLAILFLTITATIGSAMSTDRDRSWLPGIVIGGFIAKMLSSLARYYMVAVLYEGGDSFRYHEAGSRFAPAWRSLVVPVSTAGGEGTAFTEVTTGFLYAIYTPAMVGGFLFFAFLAFLGQLLFYAAFRPWLPKARLKTYAIAVLFFPSILFWPSSLGKDALMVFFLGIATYGASRLLLTYRFSSLLIIAPGLVLASSLRPHVAGLWVIALVLAALFGKAPPAMRSSPKRALMIGISLIGVAFALTNLSTTFNVSVDSSATSVSPDEFLADVSERTSQGGSAVEGGAVASPVQLPAAIIKVLFRPLIYEGTSTQVVLSALEGTALLIFTVIKLPKMWRNKRQLRENPMLLMAFTYSGGFIIAFSAINNLGILARQRVQVLPIFLALIITLSWDGYTKKSTPYADPDKPTSPKKIENVAELVGTGRHDSRGSNNNTEPGKTTGPKATAEEGSSRVTDAT